MMGGLKVVGRTYADTLGQQEVHGTPRRLLCAPDPDMEALVRGPVGAICADLHAPFTLMQGCWSAGGFLYHVHACSLVHDFTFGL